MLRRARPPRLPNLEQLAAELLGPAGLTAHATAFDRRDLLQALCQSLPPGMPIDRTRLEAAADLILRQDDAIRLATRSVDGPRWSTTELLTVEQQALALADQLRTIRMHPAPADAGPPTQRPNNSNVTDRRSTCCGTRSNTARSEGYRDDGANSYISSTRPSSAASSRRFACATLSPVAHSQW